MSHEIKSNVRDETFVVLETFEKLLLPLIAIATVELTHSVNGRLC